MDELIKEVFMTLMVLKLKIFMPMHMEIQNDIHMEFMENMSMTINLIKVVI